MSGSGSDSFLSAFSRAGKRVGEHLNSVALLPPSNDDSTYNIKTHTVSSDVRFVTAEVLASDSSGGVYVFTAYSFYPYTGFLVSYRKNGRSDVVAVVPTQYYGVTGIVSFIPVESTDSGVLLSMIQLFYKGISGGTDDIRLLTDVKREPNLNMVKRADVLRIYDVGAYAQTGVFAESYMDAKGKSGLVVAIDGISILVVSDGGYASALMCTAGTSLEYRNSYGVRLKSSGSDLASLTNLVGYTDSVLASFIDFCNNK